MSTKRATTTLVTPVRKKSSKAIYVIVSIILIIFIVFYTIWIYNSNQNHTGLFAPYEPDLGPGLVQLTDGAPLTDAEKAKRDLMVAKALEIANQRK
jgi:hypothetical protein